MFRGSVKSTVYPLHSSVSPSLPLPCVTVSHHISTGVYYSSTGRYLHVTSPIFYYSFRKHFIFIIPAKLVSLVNNRVSYTAIFQVYLCRGHGLEPASDVTFLSRFSTILSRRKLVISLHRQVKNLRPLPFARFYHEETTAMT